MSTPYDVIQNAALGRHLCIRGGLYPDDLAGVKTLILLGPNEPDFWPAFCQSPEYRDGQPDPMDRWSSRVIGDLATELDARALFPFGGPPWHPFIRWAQDSGRAWASPIQLLVHEHAGLFASYRGALAFAHCVELPPAPAQAPCGECAAPCLTACPVGALTPQGYDVPTCKSYLRTDAGQDCMENGCAARRSCPISRSYGRLREQSAFHMRAFL
ncbi:MAG: ferredoxin [Thalassovita sp.]